MRFARCCIITSWSSLRRSLLMWRQMLRAWSASWRAWSRMWVRISSWLRLASACCGKSVLRIRALLPRLPSADAASQASKPDSWADPYPAKLSSSMMRELRESVLASYPSELLNPESMPSARLMALVHKGVSEKNLKFPLWKHRLSASQEQAHQVSRPSKVPRLESLLFDDIPAKEVPSVLNHGYVQVFCICTRQPWPCAKRLISQS